MRILLVEDSEKLSISIKRVLDMSGFVTDTADTAGTAISALLSSSYDLVVLDRMLPDGEGLDVIKYCRDKKIMTRFIVLSALSQTKDKVKGLDIGADDYVAKPFEPEELLARIRSSLRRKLSDSSNNYKSFGNVTFDADTSNFRIADESFAVRRSEHLILEALFKKPGNIVTRDALDLSIYGHSKAINSNAMESHISRLRKALTDRNATIKIKTVRGVGYVLVEV